MALTDVKTAFDALELDGATRTLVDDIIDASIVRGGMTPEERQKLLDVLKVEKELTDIEITAIEGSLRALEKLGGEVDSALEQAAANLE